MTPKRVDEFTSLADLLPEWNSIPDDFKMERGDARKWTDLVSTWFFDGLKGYEFIPKPAFDKDKALSHLAVIMRSWEPKHEHKIAGVAYLMSIWFEDVAKK